jgi:hypothetical protein
LQISQITNLFTHKFNKGEEGEKKEKRSWRYSKTPMMTSPVSLKRSWWDESNDTKKDHQRWSEWMT